MVAEAVVEVAMAWKIVAAGGYRVSRAADQSKAASGSFVPLCATVRASHGNLQPKSSSCIATQARRSGGVRRPTSARTAMTVRNQVGFDTPGGVTYQITTPVAPTTNDGRSA